MHEAGVRLHQLVSEIKPKNIVAHESSSLAINSPASTSPYEDPCSTDNEKLEEVNDYHSVTHKSISADDTTFEVNERIEVVGNHLTSNDPLSIKDLELVNDKSTASATESIKVQDLSIAIDDKNVKVDYQSVTNTHTEEHNYTTLEKSPSSVNKQNTINYNLSTIGYRHSVETKQTAFDDKSTLVHEPSELDDKATKIDDFVSTLDQNSTIKNDLVTIDDFSTNDPDLVSKSTTVDNKPQ